MKYTLSTLFCFLLAISLLAQDLKPSHYPEHRPGFVTWGINGGLGWMISDVSPQFNGLGGGLTASKNLYYSPSKWLSFDARMRGVFVQSYGLDSKRNYGILDNTAVNGTRAKGIGENYILSNNKNFIFNNYKNNLAEIGFEGVFTLNRLRERKGIVVSFFGGIGLDWYKTNVNQSNGVGTYQFDYLGIDTARSAVNIKKQLKNTILDHTYTTLADGNDDFGTLTVMPSVGLELGYQVTPKFYLGLSHKLSFTRTDVLDGEQWNSAATNDLHQYTALQLLWEVENNKNEKEKRVKAPRIDVLTPNSPFNYTNEATAKLSANIENVTNSYDISLTVNGQNQDFSFNTPRLNTTVSLRRGRNEVVLKATNATGTAQEMLVFVYDEREPIRETPPTTTPPVVSSPTPPSVDLATRPSVTFTNPTATNLVVQQRLFPLTAKIIGNHPTLLVQFLVNRKEQKFTLNPNTGFFSADVSLEEGRNEVEIRAENNNGRANDLTTIMYEIPNPLPDVQILTPFENPYKTDNNSLIIKAQLKNVPYRSDITCVVNGRTVTNFSYYYNNKAGDFELALPLEEGSNRVEITARNNTGTQRDETTIVRNSPRVVPKPVITINSAGPVISANASGCSANIVATILNVADDRAVSLLVNGNFSRAFTFNPTTKIFTSSIPLKSGENKIILRAETEGSKVEESTTLMCTPKRPKQLPVVTITAPSGGMTFTAAVQSLEATILHIDSKKDIKIFLNDVELKEFKFDMLRKKLETTLQLLGGTNNIRIEATNEDGTSEEKMSVRYLSPLAEPRPKITIETPIHNSTSTRGTIDLQATIDYVAIKNDLEIWVNNTLVTTFKFNFISKTLEASLSLTKGTNTILVKAKNRSGFAEQKVVVMW